MDPDEAWDARVGTEADGYGGGGYYEEQELGLYPGGGTASGGARGGAYSGGGYGGQGGRGQVLPDYEAEERGRGRSRSREGDTYIGGSQRVLDQRYDEEIGRQNPFGDQAERSDLRGVSPRPAEERKGGNHMTVSSGDSPTERRSMFRENM